MEKGKLSVRYFAIDVFHNKIQQGRITLKWIETEQGPMAGPCEYCTELSCVVKGELND
jgi:hypothetical protein